MLFEFASLIPVFISSKKLKVSSNCLIVVANTEINDALFHFRKFFIQLAARFLILAASEVDQLFQRKAISFVVVFILVFKKNETLLFESSAFLLVTRIKYDIYNRRLSTKEVE